MMATEHDYTMIRAGLAEARTLPHISDEIERGALDILRASYWNDVRAFAAEIMADNPDDDDARQEAIHDTADGSQWVIYTWRAYLVPLLSDHADEWQEVTDVTGLAGLGGLDTAVTSAAFYALRADIDAQVEFLMRDSI